MGKKNGKIVPKLFFAVTKDDETKYYETEATYYGNQHQEFAAFKTLLSYMDDDVFENMEDLASSGDVCEINEDAYDAVGHDHSKVSLNFDYNIMTVDEVNCNLSGCCAEKPCWAKDAALEHAEYNLSDFMDGFDTIQEYMTQVEGHTSGERMSLYSEKVTELLHNNDIRDPDRCYSVYSDGEVEKSIRVSDPEYAGKYKATTSFYIKGAYIEPMYDTSPDLKNSSEAFHKIKEGDTIEILCARDEDNITYDTVYVNGEPIKAGVSEHPGHFIIDGQSIDIIKQNSESLSEKATASRNTERIAQAYASLNMSEDIEDSFEVHA